MVKYEWIINKQGIIGFTMKHSPAAVGPAGPLAHQGGAPRPRVGAVPIPGLHPTTIIVIAIYFVITDVCGQSGHADYGHHQQKENCGHGF